MKRFLFLFLFSLLSISSFGQKIRFSDSTNVWKKLRCSQDIYTTCYVGSFGYVGYIYIDTIRYLNFGDSYIREDTIANIVYIRWYNHCLGQRDTVDRVLYNYNWQINDTVRQPNFCYEQPVCWVSAIDSTKINGIWYKVWHFYGMCCGGARALKYNIIEGIGCTQSYDYAIRPYPEFEHSEQIICFSNRGRTDSLSNPVWSWGGGNIYLDNKTSCAFRPIIVNEVQPSNQSIAVVPNPTTSSITVTSPTNITKLSISNLFGQTVYTQDYNSPTVILEVADLPAGLYILRINDTEVSKFVKE